MAPPNGFTASVEGLPARPAFAFVIVAALDLVLIKLGRNELRGDVGLAGVLRGDPFGDRPVNPPEGSGIWVGRFALPGRAMTDVAPEENERVEPEVAARR